MPSLVKISNKSDIILGSSEKNITQNDSFYFYKTKAFENFKLEITDPILLKLALYVYYRNTFCLLKTEGINQVESTSTKLLKNTRNLLKFWI